MSCNKTLRKLKTVDNAITVFKIPRNIDKLT